MGVYIFDPEIPVIALDGKSGAGKGTARHGVAVRLGFHELDSGALYRAVAFQCELMGIPLTHESRVAKRAQNLDIEFRNGRVYLNAVDVTDQLRLQNESASIVAQNPRVRVALRDIQHAACKAPGLVADGRDMWKVFEKQRRLHRFFIYARPEVVARRRLDDMLALKQQTEIGRVAEELRLRDQSDLTRRVAPLERHPNALPIDTSDLSPHEVQDRIIAKYEADELLLRAS